MLRPDLRVSVWLGYEPRETDAFAVARESIRRNLSIPVPVRGLVLNRLRKEGRYFRPTEMRLGRLWDVISEAHMSTEFAISRFLTPIKARDGWAMFMDCDVLVRANILRLVDQLDDKYALYCVKHDYEPMPGVKMDGQAQAAYPRKNWSSVMVFNCEHPANQKLTVELVNSVPGRDLHRFCWLQDDQIGSLEPHWNWLVGEQPEPEDPAIVHYTLGHPNLTPALRDQPYADEWFGHLERWAM